jgi:hypothetical protein
MGFNKTLQFCNNRRWTQCTQSHWRRKSIVIVQGQTTNALLHANKGSGTYFMAARSFMDAPVAVDNKTSTAILQYVNSNSSTDFVMMPRFPSQSDTSFATNFSNNLRSLNSARYPAKVPQTVDRHLFFTVGLALDSCPICNNGSRVSAPLCSVISGMSILCSLLPQIGSVMCLPVTCRNLSATWSLRNRPIRATTTVSSIPL